MMRVMMIVLMMVVLFRISPIPHQLEGNVVISEPSYDVGYASQDGSFRILVVSGCLPWKSCGINEPTDWKIVAW